MRTILFLSAAISLLAISQSGAKPIEYPLCKSERLRGGEVLILSELDTGKCWEKLSSRSLSLQEKHKKSGLLRFVYVFGRSNSDSEFDPIFNVKYKKLAKEGEKIENEIKLYRKRIITTCGKGFFIKLKENINREMSARSVSGSHYNNYHNGSRQDPGSILSKFHIWFRDSRNKCLRTDSSELKSAFVIDNVLFPPDKSFIARLFDTGPAYASGKDASRYKQITVTIAQGTFHGKLYTSSFSIPADGDYDIVINDLSTYLGGQYRRAAMNYSIRN